MGIKGEYGQHYQWVIIQIIHSSEGISKNYPHKVPLEQSYTPEAVAKDVLKVPSVDNFTNARTKCCVLFVL